MFFGAKTKASPSTDTIAKMTRKTVTRRGRLGLSSSTITGSVIKSATKSEASRVDETTIGIGFINSPIIPLDSISGKNAHTVVMVVVRIGIRKSRQTRSPASRGENLLVL